MIDRCIIFIHQPKINFRKSQNLLFRIELKVLTANPQKQKQKVSYSVGGLQNENDIVELILITRPIEKKDSECHDGQQESDCETHLEQKQAYIGDNETDKTILAPGQYLQGTALKFRTLRDIVKDRTYDHELLASFDAYDGPHPTLPSISLTLVDENRWRMAWRASQLDKENNHRVYTREMGLLQRCENWPDLDEIFDETPIALGFRAAALIYGGLHALAWFAHFGSYTEQLLWRISAYVVMAGLPPIVSIAKFEFTSWSYLKSFKSVIPVNRYRLLLGLARLARLARLVTNVSLSAYALARAYLVVECFINLSHLPAGVYDVPSWAAYFPHIS